MSDSNLPSNDKYPSPQTSKDDRSNTEMSVAESLIYANRELRAAIMSNVIKKGLIGMGVGLGLGLFVFKRKAVPIMFTTGIGLGMAYSEGSQMVRDHHESIRRRAIEAERRQRAPFGDLH